METNEILDIRTVGIATKDVIDDIAFKITDGQVNGAYAGVILKKMANIAEKVMEIPEVKSTIIKETLKQIQGSEKGALIYGAKIIHCAVSTTYDFKECGHIVLNELYAIQEQVKEEIKLIEDELKLMIPSKDTMQNLDGKFGIKNTSKEIVIKQMPALVWNSNDDIIKVIPPKKYQKEGLKYMKV